MLLFLLVFFLLSSCFETINIMGTGDGSTSNESSSVVTLLDAYNNEIALSTELTRPTTLYAVELQGTNLDLNLKNARGVNFVDLRKIQPEGDTLRREILQPGFNHFFKLAENRGEQLYGVSLQGGKEFYIKITAQPTLIVNALDETHYQSIPYTISFEGADMKLGFEGVQDLNRIEILPYNFNESASPSFAIFLEYQGEKTIDLVEMLRKVSGYSPNGSDLYELRINASDVLGHRIFEPSSYFLRQIKPDTPLRYSITSNSRESSPKENINLCLAQNNEQLPCPSPDSTETISFGNEGRIFGNEGRIFLDGLQTQGNDSSIEKILRTPIPLEQLFGQQINFSSLIFQKKDEKWERFGEGLLSDGSIWLVPELLYKDDDLLTYDFFIQVLVNLLSESVYKTERLSYRYPCTQIVVQEPNSGEYHRLDDSEDYADLRDNRQDSVFGDLPSSLGKTALNSPPVEEKKTCADYTGADYDNYYILPPVSESNKWKGLKFALAWDENWNYEDFRYSFEVERQEVKAGAEWLSVSLTQPAALSRYIAFDLLRQDIPDDTAKKSILRYRLKPIAQHEKIPHAIYKRPIDYYFIRYPQLYPGIKKYPEEKPSDNLLFIDLDAKFLTNPDSRKIAGFFRYDDKTLIRQTELDNSKYYQLESVQNQNDTASLKFFIPTDDDFGFTQTDYDNSSKKDRRRVKSWSIGSSNFDIKFLISNKYEQFFTIDKAQNDVDRVLELEARNEAQRPSCTLISVSLLMNDGETTASEFPLCIGNTK